MFSIFDQDFWVGIVLKSSERFADCINLTFGVRYPVGLVLSKPLINANGRETLCLYHRRNSQDPDLVLIHAVHTSLEPVHTKYAAGVASTLAGAAGRRVTILSKQNSRSGAFLHTRILHHYSKCDGPH